MPPNRLTILIVAAVVARAPYAPARADESPAVAEVVDVAPVWSGHRVGFALLTGRTRQFVAFYDADRRMTVAQRDLGSTQWTFRRLDSKLGWDSHNYITMAFDRDGHVHLCGNMHVHPLVYFRTAEPGDVTSFEAIHRMVGDREQRCTYPRFLTGASGELIFMYRDGASGRGARLFNVYNPDKSTWSRLIDRPLLDGVGRMNAYPVGPSRGPDGRFHLCWVWRDTPDCSTNHDLGYARSRDLVHWETATGESVPLPITPDKASVTVDPVPPGGGMINGNTRIGFDSKHRPIVSYHKFDSAGMTQVYNARFEDGRWRIRRVTDWAYRWEFKGGGSIPFEIRVSGVRLVPGGELRQSFSHDKHGSGTWRLDEQTLEPIGLVREAPPWPQSLAKPHSDFPGIQVRWASDSGGSDQDGVRYAMRWESLGPNRDRPHPKAPPPSMLRVYKLRSDRD